MHQLSHHLKGLKIKDRNSTSALKNMHLNSTVVAITRCRLAAYAELLVAVIRSKDIACNFGPLRLVNNTAQHLVFLLYLQNNI